MYINPPFSRYSDAVNCLYIEQSEQIWILDNGKTETKYAQKLLREASALCFLSRRVPFIDPRTDLPAKKNRSGQILIYRGTDTKRFWHFFNHLGVVNIQK
jgi:hypothetical protein